MIPIELLKYQNELKVSYNNKGQRLFFDPIRKKNVRALPEEMIRQLCIQYLTKELNYPIARIQVERSIIVENTPRRYDIIVYDYQLKPFLLVECKSFKVKVSQVVFDQIAMYNIESNAPYLWVSNGQFNFLCSIDKHSESYEFLDSFPEFPSPTKTSLQQ